MKSVLAGSRARWWGLAGRAAALAGLCALLPLGASTAEQYDVVIAGGRVMDPATGTDRVADVGIRGARIETTNGHGLAGRLRLDASGKVVAPGFIDILSNT